MNQPAAARWLLNAVDFNRYGTPLFALRKYKYGMAIHALLRLFSWRAQIWWCAGQALGPAQLLWRRMRALAASARARVSARTGQAAPTASSSSSRATKAQVHVDEHSDFSSRVQALKAEAYEEVTACTLCYEAPRAVAFQPCGHVVCCDSCFKELKRRAGQRALLECPVCKQVVRGHVAGLRF